MNKPKSPENYLLEDERKELFGRITEYIGKVFAEMTKKGAKPKWSAKEIAAVYDIQNTHVTEFKNYKKYKREISQNELQRLIAGGLVTIKELTDSCARNEKERRHLQNKFRLLWLEELAKKHGMDAVDILENHLKKKGVDIDANE
jgi:hypothetical protein